MHFGKPVHQFFITLSVAIITISSCKNKEDQSFSFLSPTEGARVTSGQTLILKTDAAPGAFDSIKYFIDSRPVKSVADTQSVKFLTSEMPFGGRLITAVIYSGSDSVEINTNFQHLPSKPPFKLSYAVVNTYSHDTSSYTQGLQYVDGIFYESDGLRGESSLRKVEVKTGKVIKKVDIPAKYFAEGIAVVGDKVVMLTYQEGLGFVFDKNTLAKIAEFPYPGNREGWGLTFDGTHLLNSDGTNTIYYLNKDTYQIQKSIEVYDHNGPVQSLNEMEYIDGKIYANIYGQDRIVIIDPATGGVQAELNLAELAPYKDRVETGFVLNGIAYHPKTKNLFVTGKKWNKLYEIQVN
jgi:glutaminyl-peptide cyclotransferase